jgi:hypothetical protein
MTDESLFAEALAIAAGAERTTYLEKHSIDPQQKQRVLELLQASEGTNVLDNPVQEFESRQTTNQGTEPLAEAGEQIGPYKLIEKIGLGCPTKRARETSRGGQVDQSGYGFESRIGTL